MTAAKTLLGIIPAMQASSLLAENIPRKRRKARLVNTAMKNIVGTELIRANAQMIGFVD